MKVDRYVEPVEFAKWKDVAESMGFLYVASGPLVRSSYKVHRFPFRSKRGLRLTDFILYLQAGEFYLSALVNKKKNAMLA